MNMPVGGTGTSYERELPKAGVVDAWLHGVWLLGKFKEIDKEKTREAGETAYKYSYQGVAVFEIDQRQATGARSGERFLIFKRETWSLNEKANLRTKYAKAFKPETEFWDDDQFAKAHFGIVRNERSDDYIHGHCKVKIRTTSKKWGDNPGGLPLKNATIDAMQKAPEGSKPFKPEFDFTEEVPYLVDLWRGNIEGKESIGLVAYEPELFDEPLPPKRAEENRQKAHDAEVKATTPDSDYPEDWDTDDDISF